MSSIRSRRPICEPIEARILFSIDLAPFSAGILAPAVAATHEIAVAAPGPQESQPNAATDQQPPPSIELAIIDASVTGADQLISDIEAEQERGRSILIIRVDAQDDGVAAISEALANAGSPVSAIHVLGHGDQTGAQLGSSRIDASSLRARAGEFAAWSGHLTKDADLLLYGCDIASAQTGQELARDLAQLTGADVAASVDLTGNRMVGGNWQLELQTGAIESATVIDALAQANWTGVLATFMVSNTNDSGAGSLRQAITLANATAGPDTILFNIGAGGAQTIALSSALPFITEQVIIDGQSQPGFTGAPLIELDGSSAGANTDGFSIAVGGVTIQGLVINRFSASGINIWGDGGNSIVGNYIGLDQTGSFAAPNGGNGISISTANNQIGSAGLGRNVISGNQGAGIVMANSANSNLVQGNYVGLNSAGNAAVANSSGGVIVTTIASNNLIGGIGQGNVVSGNSSNGIGVYDYANATRVVGNYVGTDASGLIAIPNAQSGIAIAGSATSTVIGGALAGEGNAISGNTFHGIFTHDDIGTSIRGNLIGPNATNTATLGNGTAGISLNGLARNSMIGGTNFADANIITGNTAGVIVANSAVDNSIFGNSIFGNTGLAIDLALDGVTNNDVLDADFGPNGLQNYPVLTAANSNGTDIFISGTLNSLALGTFRIEFFSSPTGSPSGFGEGRTYLGSIFVSTDGLGDASFSPTLSGIAVPAGHVISATATQMTSGLPGSTSEFAGNVVLSNLPPGISTSPPTSSVTFEGGATTSFNVVLDTAPTTNVVIPISSNDLTEAAVSASALTFTPANWSVTQTVTVTGVDDTVVDGNIGYFVVIGAAVSADPAYNGLNHADIGLSNIDNDAFNTLHVTNTSDLANGSTGSIAALLANDGGDGISLREALLVTNNTANGVGGADRILFNIAGAGVHTIAPTAPLPLITDAVLIDGYSQSGALRNTALAGTNAVLRIELSGQFAGAATDGLEVLGGGSGSTITGLAVNRWGEYGIVLTGSSNNTIVGNFIGTNASGLAAAPNQTNGVHLIDAGNNQIGTAALGDRNLIAGNARAQIFLDGGLSSGNRIQGNQIASNAAGTAGFPSLNEGIGLSNGAHDNLIGGISSGTGNTLVFAGTAGVAIQSTGAVGNAVLGNSISNSPAIGIDLNPWAHTANDAGDVDVGPNNGQNYPVLSFASVGGGWTTIAGMLQSEADSFYRIEFFANTIADPSGFGQGQRFLGHADVGTDALGNAAISLLTTEPVVIGEFISATATRTDATFSQFTDTSEFGNNVIVIAANTPPTIAFGEGDKSYTEQTAAILIDTAATVSDPGQANFSGGSLQVNIAANASVGDRLAIVNQGGGAGQIGFVGSSVSFGGVVIGSVTNTGSSLFVAFNGNATPGAVQALIRNLSFESLGEDPSTLTRTIQVRLDDGAGSVSAAITKQLAVTGDTDLWVTTASDIADGNTASIDALLADRGADAKISLREAILATNNTANTFGPDLINFNIGGAGVRTISLTSALPLIADPIIINGYSQVGSSQNTITTGSNAKLLIELSGQSAGAADGLRITSGGSGSLIAGLVINQFSGSGISLLNTSSVRISGNFVGTDSTGISALANSNAGIYVGDSSANIIGGNSPADRNLLSSSDNSQIVLTGATTSGNAIQGNLIGSDASGNVGLPGLFNGIDIDSGARDNLIGGTNPGEGNLIAFNSTSGISAGASAGAGNAFVGNSFKANQSIAIDLFPFSPTDNDPGDLDIGPNNLQNHPELSSARLAGSQVTIEGQLRSFANRFYRIEFYASASGDPSGFGEGERYLGFANVATDANGDALFTAVLTASVALGETVSAIAVLSDVSFAYTGDTSEFGRNVLVTNAATAGVLVTPIGAATTTEAGAGTQFSLVLSSAPTSDVLIALTSSDPGEGTLATNLLTFTTANWSVAQNVVVTGVDDLLDDGDIVYAILTGAATSADPSYSGLAIDDWTLTNNDNDAFNQIYVDTANDLADGDTSSLANLVGNKGADGLVSLREAIAAANNTANGSGGVDRILFNIGGGGPQSLAINGSALPTITDGVLIDGASQPGWLNSPLIQLDGASAGGGANGLTITAPGTTVRALSISRFDSAGVVVAGATPLGVSILGNSIHSNGGLGIDVRNDGVTANSAVDLAQDFPVLAAATTNGVQLIVDASFSGVALRSYRFEFFASVGADASGHGEGQVLLGADTATTDAAGNLALSPTLVAAVPAGRLVSATATDLVTGTTSEFAQNVVAAGTNLAPTITSPAAFSLVEDFSMTLSGVTAIRIADPDAGAAVVRTTLAVSNGTLSLASTAGLSLSVGTGGNDASMTFTGTIASTNAALDGLIYRPFDNFAGVDSLQVSVNDLGNTGNGGAQIANGIVIVTVNPVNDAPSGANHTASTAMNTPYVFTVGDFGFSDANDTPGHALSNIRVTTLSGAGGLSNNGVALTAGQLVTVADIAAGRLIFTPAPFAFGAGYASFSFQVQDDGGTTNGGADLDPTPRTMTIDVIAVNQTPVATAQVFDLNEEVPLIAAAPGVLAGASDSDGDALTALLISGPAHAVAFSLNADGSFSYTPRADYNGLDSFVFAVSDGALQSTPATALLQIAAVNDAPAGEVVTPPPTREVGQPTVAVSQAVATATTSDGKGAGGTIVAIPVVEDTQTQNRRIALINPDDANGTRRRPVVPPNETRIVKNDDRFGVRKLTAVLDEAKRHEELTVRVFTASGEPLLKRSYDGRRLFDPLKVDRARAATDLNGDFSPARFQLKLPAELLNWAPDEMPAQAFHVTLETVQMGSAAVSIGLMFYALRAGGLAAAMLTALPAWSGIDPLVVLSKNKKDKHADFGDDNDLVGEMAEDEAGVRDVIGINNQFDDEQDADSAFEESRPSWTSR